MGMGGATRHARAESGIARSTYIRWTQGRLFQVLLGARFLITVANHPKFPGKRLRWPMWGPSELGARYNAAIAKSEESGPSIIDKKYH